jgi:hypothetical protein
MVSVRMFVFRNHRFQDFLRLTFKNDSVFHIGSLNRIKHTDANYFLYFLFRVMLSFFQDYLQ